MSVRTRTVLVLFFFGPGAPAMPSSEGGRWKGWALSFVFVASLSVRPQIGRWPSSTGSLLLSLFCGLPRFRFAFVCTAGRRPSWQRCHRGIGGMFGWKEREEGGWVVPSFAVASLSVCLRWTPDERS